MTEARIDQLERQVGLLENYTLSLNNLWKMSIIIQGPTFTDAVIKNLENLLSSEPNDPVVQDAKNDLEKAAEMWKSQTEEGSFGLEALREELEASKARLMTMEFLFHISIAQQGPGAIQTILKNIEDAYIEAESPSNQDFVRHAKMRLEEFRRELRAALEAWARQSQAEELHHA